MKIINQFINKTVEMLFQVRNKQSIDENRSQEDVGVESDDEELKHLTATLPN